MSTMPRTSAIVAFALVGLLGLSACASAPGSRPPTSDGSPQPALATASPAPPAGDVVGAGTVMDIGGSVELCLGAVAESYPPQCSGVPLTGWSWEGVEGAESSGEVTWGAYAVTGRYDGDSFAVTQPPMLLALYDPMMPDDPTGGTTGDTSEARLIGIQEQLPALLGDDGVQYLSSFPEQGRLWVDVLWDDGTLQAAADEDFGDGVVIIRSALRPTEG